MSDDRTQAATSVRNPIPTGEYQPDSTHASHDTPPDATGRHPEPLPDVPGYAVTGELARGGMGRVLAATDPVFGREVAVKVLLPAADPADAARRFRREAVITGRLSHPNIPPAHVLGTLADGSPFLDMKLVRGDTLAAQLKARPDPGHDLPRLVGVFEAICQAVGYAHTKGVVHRDLKPANVMVGAFGEVQVMDWGIAWEKDEGGRMKDESDAAPVSDSSFILPPSSFPIVGTPSYMAPEQARGEAIDARADVFALGGVLCATLTGHAAFRGRDAREVTAKAAAADVADAHARLDACGADPELVALAKRCLAPDRVDRPADGTAVAADVAAYRAGVEARLRAAERERAAADARAAEWRKRRTVLLALGAALAVIVAGGVGVVVWRGWEANRREAEERQERAVAGEAVAGLLTHAEAALGKGDADRAEPFVGQAARRAADADLTEHAARLAAARAALAVLRALDAVDDDRWTPVGTKFRSRDAVAKKWAAAFADFGVVPGTTPPAEA
ncbi:MAG TPA: serine/threonine-protein kinase, partial [Urbifossiella sp.]|nr:serine/threonine-protein kinase [Urbifossiella sp.]